MSKGKNSVTRQADPPEARTAPQSLPPLPASRSTSPEDAATLRQAREQKAALVRGVTSIQEMRDAIRRVARDAPAITAVPRTGMLDTKAFRVRADWSNAGHCSG